MTPEGRVKHAVKSVLDPYQPALWYYMPVQSGYGRRVLDFIGCYKGLFFAIETKAPGGHLTSYQELTRDQIGEAKGKVFEIQDERGIEELKAWLTS